MADLKLDKAYVMNALAEVAARAHESIEAAAKLLGADVETVAEVLAAPAQHLSINAAAHAEVLDFDLTGGYQTEFTDVGMSLQLLNNQRCAKIPKLKAARYRVIILINKVG